MRPSDTRASVFVGCQESAVREGTYAVRFLFAGATPVVCAEGGGCLRAEITEVPNPTGRSESDACAGDWSACTFRDLRAEGRYVFFVYTDHGTVRVLYENGRFGGYT